MTTFKDEVAECEATEESAEAIASAGLVNEFTHKSRAIMEAHPVNVRRRAEGKLPANLILLRDGGDHVPQVPPMRERFGVNLGCFVEMPVERGIARYLGMAVVEVPHQPGASRGDVYRAWAERAVQVLPQYDGLYLHLKGPDEPGHDGNVEMKQRVIEEIDAHFFGTLHGRIDPSTTLVAVTADHATPCELGAHSADPVPLLLSGARIAPDRAGRFTEASASRGTLGHLRGVDVLPMIVSRR